MTLNDFIMKYYGKNVKYNKSTSGYQCVDLAKAWCVEGLGIYEKFPELKTSWAWGEGAKFWYKNRNNISKSFFKFIDNEFDTIPKAGDLCVFGNGTYGHICIVVFANQNRMITFDQNFNYANSPCSLNYRNYNNVLGFMRKKG